MYPLVLSLQQTFPEADLGLLQHPRWSLCDKLLEAVNYYYKAFHLGCCSSPRSTSWFLWRFRNHFPVLLQLFYFNFQKLFWNHSENNRLATFFCLKTLHWFQSWIIVVWLQILKNNACIYKLSLFRLARTRFCNFRNIKPLLRYFTISEVNLNVCLRLVYHKNSYWINNICCITIFQIVLQ